jgi:hypothetical protein
MEKYGILRGAVVSRMAIHQDRTEVVKEEIINKMGTHQERMEDSTNAWWKEMMACQEATEGYLEKPKANPEKMKVGQEEMEAAVETNHEEVNDTDLESNREEKEGSEGASGST